MLGFKSFDNARIVLAGIELIHKLKKDQYDVPYSSGTLSRNQQLPYTQPPVSVLFSSGGWLSKTLLTSQGLSPLISLLNS
jgi:hypothetical protein